MFYSYCFISNDTVRLNVPGGYEYLKGEYFENFLECLKEGRKITNNRDEMINYLNYCRDGCMF